MKFDTFKLCPLHTLMYLHIPCYFLAFRVLFKSNMAATFLGRVPILLSLDDAIDHISWSFLGQCPHFDQYVWPMPPCHLPCQKCLHIWVQTNTHENKNRYKKNQNWCTSGSRGRTRRPPLTAADLWFLYAQNTILFIFFYARFARDSF